MTKRARFLIPNEPYALRIYPALAEEIGLAESIVLLQLEYLVGISTTEVIEDELWTYQSLTDLRKHFKWWSTTTIWRICKNLEQMKLIKLGNFNRASFDHTQWFTICWEECTKLSSIRVDFTIFQNEKSIRSNRKIDLANMKNRSGQNETTIPQTPTETPTQMEEEDPALVLLYGHWQSILGQLRPEMKRSDYETWVASLFPVGKIDQLIIMGTTNTYARDWVDSRLKSRITRLYEALYKEEVHVEFRVAIQ